MRTTWKIIWNLTKSIIYYANHRLTTRLLLSAVSLPFFIIFGLIAFLNGIYGHTVSEALGNIFQALFFVPRGEFDDFVLFMQSLSPALSDFVLFYFILATLTLLTGSICFRLSPTFKEGLYPHGFSFKAVQFKVDGYELTDGTTFINTSQLLTYMWQMPFAWVSAPILVYCCGYVLFGCFAIIFMLFGFLFFILYALISEYIYELDINFLIQPNTWLLVLILIFSTAMLLLGYRSRFVKTENDAVKVIED